ncbi:ferritin-like domain-containing protein [Termitidicoccus mucosus]|uniref:Uncharacterized protein n=1 Tax=Termitidicoccus mucosus TaxID=1184151 RepID=A0A178II84_9BACT|nr:hypothetical protein AW736_12185 [Opitutaceae bacterium TSB47]
MTTTDTLHDLYIEQLRDLYNAENQLLKALPEMAKAAYDPSLKEGITTHLEQTKEHVRRLENIFENHDESPKGKTCKAMEGLIAEGRENISEHEDLAVRDAGLIADAQRIEHYEIAGYGCVRTFAGILGHDRDMVVLQQTLDEEGETDKELTAIAGRLNFVAQEGGEDDK